MTFSRISFTLFVVTSLYTCYTVGQIPVHLPYAVQKSLEYRFANDAISYNLARLVFSPKKNDTFFDCDRTFAEFNPLLVDLRRANWTVLYMAPKTDRAESCVEKIYANDFYFYRSLDSDQMLCVDQVLYVRNSSDLPGWSTNVRAAVLGRTDDRSGKPRSNTRGMRNDTLESGTDLSRTGTDASLTDAL